MAKKDANKSTGTSLTTTSPGLPEKSAFKNLQLDIFQTFYANTDEDKSNASNAIELWDSVPKYSVSQVAMNKMRDSNGMLDLLEVEFHYRQTKLKAIVQPALIREEVDGELKTLAYYPSANEELIEEVLKKFAAQQNYGFHESNKKTGVLFSLYQLKKELQERGHSRSITQIKRSINILSGSIIEIKGTSGNMVYSKKSAYISNVTSVTQEDLKEDPNAQWHISFHPMVTDSIDKLNYRQFNYQTLMSHKTQLARWIHKYIVSRYTMASRLNYFEIRYSTIKRDSNMLNNYSIERVAIQQCDASLQELVAGRIAIKVEKEVDYGKRKKIEDVIYKIYPTSEFVAEVKASNKRKSDGSDKLGVSSIGTP